VHIFTLARTFLQYIVILIHTKAKSENSNPKIGVMEFQECFSLLATRPTHAHEHCEEEQQVEDQPQDSSIQDEAENDDSNEDERLPEDLALLSARELVRTFHRLQETRVQIYTAFRQCVQGIVKSMECLRVTSYVRYADAEASSCTRRRSSSQSFVSARHGTEIIAR
jgi:hypothetical protein